MGIKHLLIGAVAILPAWTAASAQDASDYLVRVGLGGQLRPKYPGADDRELAPLFDIDVAKGTNEFRFEGPDDKFGIPLIEKGGFAFGPAANIQTARLNKDVGAPVGKVKTTIEVGAFAEYFVLPSVRVRAEALKGIGGHKGIVGSIGADQVWRDGDRFVFSVGPRLELSDSRYQRAYFGVDTAAALASGLPTYRPSSGVYGAALASGLSYQFNSRWGLFGLAKYERLVGDAAKSPIVREYGSRNQFSGGVGLSYTFNIKR